MKTHYFHFIALLFISGAASTELSFPVPADLWEPEEWRAMNVEGEYVKGVADIAVWEHNEATKDTLVFQSLVSGEEKMASDRMSYGYRLLLTAKDGDAVPKMYRAGVVEQPGFYEIKLMSFERVLEQNEQVVLQDSNDMPIVKMESSSSTL